MHQRPLALTLLALAGVAGLVAANQALIANQSEVMYVATQMGSEVEGNFGRFEAQINLDPDKPQTSSVWFAVDTSSVIFPSPDVLKELAKPDWFDTAHYPRAEFRSSRILNAFTENGIDRGEITVFERPADYFLYGR